MSRRMQLRGPTDPTPHTVTSPRRPHRTPSLGPTRPLTTERDAALATARARPNLRTHLRRQTCFESSGTVSELCRVRNMLRSVPGSRHHRVADEANANYWVRRRDQTLTDPDTDASCGRDGRSRRTSGGTRRWTRGC